MIKGTYGLIGRNSSTLSHQCTKIDAYRSCGRGDITFLFCQAKLSEQMIKGKSDFVNGTPST